jgi:hypothetical protein
MLHLLQVGTKKVFDIISSVEAGASVVDVINNMDL